MQAWNSARTRCFICSLRRGLGQPLQRHGLRTEAVHVRRVTDHKGDYKFTSSASVYRVVTKKESRRQVKLARQARLEASQMQEKRRQRRTTLRLSQPLQTIVESCATLVQRQLMVSSNKEDLPLLKQFDPDDQKWPAFVDYLQKLTAEDSALAENQDQKLRGELKEAHELGPETLKSTIKHAFLDTVVMSGDASSASAIADLRYPTEWYATARMSQRTIHLHVGPTNSGKTYNALKRLQESADGFFAGPLRLLAHEVYSRFRAAGIPCDLITGDDVRLDESPETKVTASTVEMVDTERKRAVAVIDEIQMMADEERGWAWTRAFLGASVDEVHLCGETRVIPLVRELVASMGDTLHIHRYNRLNQLKPMSRSLRGNLKNLRKGDAIVAFSVMEIHALKKEIELQTGSRVAIVYGSLPPETRAKQAELFNDPFNDYDFLVASDAIGMGLNLSIKRIIFHSLTKWNGTKQVQLTIPQIKQIAGRAGRYRTSHQATHQTSQTSEQDEANVGLVTCFDEEELPLIHKALNTEPPPLRHAGVVPPIEIIEKFASRLPSGLPFEYILRKICDTSQIHSRFKICDMRDSFVLAGAIEDINGLTIGQRSDLAAAPANIRDHTVRNCFRAYAKVVAQRKAVSIVDIPDIPLEVLNETPSADPTYLQGLESLHKGLILWLWLSYRFPTNFIDRPVAQRAKEITEKRISHTLSSFSANPKLRTRLERLQRVQGRSPSTMVSGPERKVPDARDAEPMPRSNYKTVDTRAKSRRAPREQKLAVEDQLSLGGKELDVEPILPTLKQSGAPELPARELLGPLGQTYPRNEMRRA